MSRDRRDRDRDRDRDRANTHIEDDLAAKFASVDKIGGMTASEIVAMADSFGRILARSVRLKTTQVRKFFEAVKQISARLRTDQQLDLASECALLRPLLAYTAGRVDTVKPLMKVLDPCLQKISSAADFQVFHRFLESTLAYHRYYGGRDY